MTYSERTEKISKLEMARLNSKWVTRPSGEAATKKISEDRRRLWGALNAYIGRCGGWVSQPNVCFAAADRDHGGFRVAG